MIHAPLASIRLAQSHVRPHRRPTSRWRRVSAGLGLTLALGLGSASGAGAATLYSGYIASTDAAKLICYVLNVGSTPVKVSGSHITNDGGFPALQFGDCGFIGTLQPGKRCAFYSMLDDGAASITVDSGKGVIRATCQLDDANGNILATTPMR